jgi:hypothetical protein
MKGAIFILPFPLDYIRGPFPYPFLGVSVISSLQPVCITKPIPHPTHFNPEEGGNMFLQNVGIHLEGFTVSHHRGS